MGSRYRYTNIVLTFVLLTCIVPLGFAQDGAAVSEEKTVDSADKAFYRIGSGDILEILTWKEEDFSRPDVLVRTDGNITFPLIGDIQAAGLTPLQLKENIEAGLAAFVSSPNTTVTVRSAESQKFYILGEVARAGEYPLKKSLTILQAFALAGGFTEWASKNEIILLRQDGDQEKMIRVNYKNIVKGKNLNQNKKIMANDTIIVP